MADLPLLHEPWCTNTKTEREDEPQTGSEAT